MAPTTVAAPLVLEMHNIAIDNGNKYNNNMKQIIYNNSVNGKSIEINATSVQSPAAALSRMRVSHRRSKAKRCNSNSNNEKEMNQNVCW